MDGSREPCRWDFPNVIGRLEFWHTVVRNHDVRQLSVPRTFQPSGVGVCQERTEDRIAISLPRKTVSRKLFVNVATISFNLVFQLEVDSVVSCCRRFVLVVVYFLLRAASLPLPVVRHNCLRRCSTSVLLPFVAGISWCSSAGVSTRRSDRRCPISSWCCTTTRR